MAVSALYEAVVWRTIRAQAQPCLLGPRLARVSSLCAVSGCVIYFMADQDKEVTMFEFDCSVDVVGWSSDALLVAGDRQGMLHFIAPNLGTVLFSQQLGSGGSSQDAEEPCFKAIELTAPTQEGVCELLVLGSKGLLHVFQNLQITKLQAALLNSDAEAVKKLQSAIVLSQLDLIHEHGRCVSSILPLPHLSNGSTILVSLGSGDNGLCIWEKSSQGSYEKQDAVSYMLQGTAMTACDRSNDGRYLVTLTYCEAVVVWLLSSLVMVNVWSPSRSRGAVKDFALCQSLAGSSFSASLHCSDQLCLITEDKDRQRALQLVSLPSLAVIHSMPVSKSAVLFHGHLSEEYLFFIEESGEEEQCFIIKQLSQALPENRLTSLLTQQRFCEAEEFAQKFNLDPQLVYRSKADVLNALACRADTASGPSSLDSGGDTLLDTLTQCLDKVEDVSFVVALVLRSPYPSLEATLRLLHFAKAKLHACSGSSNDTDSMILKL